MKKKQDSGKLPSTLQLQAGSLNRAVILLMTIAQGSRKGSSLQELVAKTNLPRPTIHRVMDMLIDIGWVSRDTESSKFNLSQGLATLGYSAISRYPIERIAHTSLAILANKLDQVVYLGVRSSLDMVCIGRYESESLVQVGKGHVGLRVPFGMSPSCMAMLTRLPEAEVREIVKVNMPRYKEIPGFDDKGFLKALEAAIQNGYSNFDGIVLDHSTSGLGVPILDESGYPIAGIGTTFITSWLNEEKRQNCLMQLKDTAQEIEKLLSINLD